MHFLGATCGDHHGMERAHMIAGRFELELEARGGAVVCALCFRL